MEKKGPGEAYSKKQAAELDVLLERFITSLEKKLQHIEYWPDVKWKDEIEKHPLEVKENTKPTRKLRALYKFWEQLKYDPDKKTREELAVSYKEDGNFHYKQGHFRLAIATYTEGIKTKCGNKEIEANLLNNRSTANFSLKNYHSCMEDCQLALKLMPHYEKVSVRAANCAFKMERFMDAINHCETILERNKDNEPIATLKKKSIVRFKSWKMHVTLEISKSISEQFLLDVIKSRGVQFFGFKNNEYEVKDLQPINPQLALNRVCISDEKKLVWPVTLVYPELKQVDCVAEFCEDEVFGCKLLSIFMRKRIFGMGNTYLFGHFSIYFENFEKEQIFPVVSDKTLGEVLKDKNYFICNGTPTFIIVSKNSETEGKLINGQLKMQNMFSI